MKVPTFGYFLTVVLQIVQSACALADSQENDLNTAVTTLAILQLVHLVIMASFFIYQRRADTIILSILSTPAFIVSILNVALVQRRSFSLGLNIFGLVTAILALLFLIILVRLLNPVASPPSIP